MVCAAGLAQQTLATVWNLADIDKVRGKKVIGVLAL